MSDDSEDKKMPAAPSARPNTKNCGDNIDDDDVVEILSPGPTAPNPPAADSRDGNDNEWSSDLQVNHELPFLVTHWLSNFDKNPLVASDASSNSQGDAIRRIHRAAAELASAFHSIGAFGTARRPTFNVEDETMNDCNNNSDLKVQSSAPHYATFSDVKRRWAQCPPEQLSHIVSAALSAGISVDSSIQTSQQVNWMAAAEEQIQQQRRNPESGRTLNEAITLDDDAIKATKVPSILSALQCPVLLQTHAENENQNSKTDQPPPKPPAAAVVSKDLTAPGPLQSNVPGKATISVASKFSHLSAAASVNMKKYLELRDKCLQEKQQLQGLYRSLEFQTRSMEEWHRKRASIDGQNGGIDLQSKLTALEEIVEGEKNCERVVAHINRQLSTLQLSFQADSLELSRAKAAADQCYRQSKTVLEKYRDPYADALSTTRNCMGRANHRLLLNVRARELGLDRMLARNAPRSMGRIRTSGFASELHQTLVRTRLAHAATISTHLHYPIYCLRFDRTGQFFITGADDFLVKVFCLGSNIPPNKHRKVDPSEYIRGAILVCTLRGHAGVINDIDVSSDNAFLATASEDGDCRVWGLKDGCPVAILRGHLGGANMVSWSSLTPYRLTTVGGDGLARTWEVREACLKRYGVYVGNRPDYKRSPSVEIRYAASTTTTPVGSAVDPNPAVDGAAEAPEPQREAAIDQPVAPPQPEPEIRLPPLPPAQNARVPGQRRTARDRIPEVEPGRFVANDNLDEGVKLVSKFQHGSIVEDHMGGPETRSRRSLVKVICVARCPNGGHFATGSSDGICRIWRDDDDAAIESVDFSKVPFPSFRDNTKQAQLSSRRKSANSLLLTLKGHLSTITDLQYSYKGDRILTASQKDGVVRVWSWNVDPAMAESVPSTTKRDGPACQTSHILFKLTNPNAQSSSAASIGRRRLNKTAVTTVCCDVAAWLRDDTKIVTAQSEALKQNGTEIVRGSQYLFIWDSVTGSCLLGIAEAHTKQCPVLIPHPSEPSLICSAAADGFVRLWDLETGTCVFSHENKLEFGPMDPNDRGKNSGFLDGAFFPDGTGIVLTDDGGRVTVIDALKKPTEGNDQPAWMREQYFSNDYYELFYDPNGYCIERGSEQPPHLAPRGVRCSHSGAPFSESVTDSFKNLIGPVPLNFSQTKWHRQEIRTRALSASDPHTIARKNTVCQFDPRTTTLIHAGVSEPLPRMFARRPVPPTPVEPSSPPRNERPTTSSSGRLLSSNYRWRDYADVLREEVPDNDEPDPDDEEFSLTAARRVRTPASNAAGSDSDGDIALEADDDDITMPTPESQETVVRSRVAQRRAESVRVRSNSAPRQPVGARQRRRARQPQAPRASQPQARIARVMESSHPQLSNSSQPRAQRSRDNQDTAPTRASTRQVRRRYFTDESEDEEDVQVLSTNNDPSGPYVADYDAHFFKMTNYSQAAKIRRQWARRVESTSSYLGRKSYTPQIGDLVVYIPRAHYEIISIFPFLPAPWQSWPNEAEWPVVRCSVRNVRYRFPYINAFSRNSGAKTIRCIVAILTLEVTGIPELSTYRQVAWPKPSFISPRRKHKFEVSIFESDDTDFIIPLGLYAARIAALDGALCRQDHPGVEICFCPDAASDIDDPELTPFRGTVESITIPEHELSDPSLCGSGYETILVRWDDETYSKVSPWELNVSNVAPRRPRLTADDKNTIKKAILAVSQVPEVEASFLHPVGDRYIDYDSRVEVAMDLTFMGLRLEADYYGNKYSAVADARLIRDNCFKYNSEGHSISAVAQSMYENFKQLVLSDQERDAFENVEIAMAIDSSYEMVEHDAGPASAISPTRQSRMRSTLESISPPRSERSPRQRLATSRGRAPAGGQSIVAPAPSDGRRSNHPPPAVSRGQNGTDARGRRRNTTRSGVEIRNQPDFAPPVVRRSVRSSSRAGGNEDENRNSSNNMESLLVTASARPSTRSGMGIDQQTNHPDSSAHATQSLSTENSLYTPSSGGVAGMPASNGDRSGVSRSRATRGSTRAASELENDELVLSPRRATRSSEDPAEKSAPSVKLRLRVWSKSAIADAERNGGDHEGIDSDKQGQGRGTTDDSERSPTIGRKRRSGLRSSEPSTRNDNDSQSDSGASQGRRWTSKRESRTSMRNVAPDSEASSDDDYNQKQENASSGDDDMIELDDDTKPTTRRLRSRRRQEQDDVESEESEVSSDHREESNVRRSFRRQAARKKEPVDSSSCSSDENGSHNQPDLRARAPRRKISKRAPALNQSDSNESDQEDRKQPATRTRSRDRASSISLQDSNMHRTRGSSRYHEKQSYAEPSSSEFGSEVEESSQEDEPPATFNRSRTKRATSNRNGPPAKKMKKESNPESADDDIPEPKVWVDCKFEQDQISLVAFEVLARLKKLDKDGAFAAPVVESFPNLAKTYLSIIENPMDFRTIEEERIFEYNHIDMLRRDLVLVFRNCIRYNKPGTKYNKLARKLLEMLTDIFRQVCIEIGVLLPRRF